MSFTQSQVDVNNAKVAAKRGIKSACPDDAVTREADLHFAIMAECRRRRWQYLHGSMSQETSRTLGEPDFVLLCDQGRVFFIECKSKQGKLSPVQQAFKHAAEFNGHKIHVIRSMTEFLQIVEPLTK